MRITLITLSLLTALSLLPSNADDPSPGKQVEQKLTLDNKAIPYLIHLPKDYASSNKWPLMLFLHGRGESFGPLSIVKKWGPPKMAERGDSLPFVLVSPQCPTNSSWGHPSQQELLLGLLDHIEKTYKIDRDRVYLTGLSMGGYGSWQLAADHPDRFAAVVPICGGGKPENAGKLKDLPIWVWHGTEDRAVPLLRSTAMVEAIEKVGGTKIRFTTLEHIGHNSWEAAYSSPELYDWLGKQSRAPSATSR